MKNLWKTSRFARYGTRRKNGIFSVVDVVSVLTDIADYQAARKYWKVLKNLLKTEVDETATNCTRLKMLAKEASF